MPDRERLEIDFATDEKEIPQSIKTSPVGAEQSSELSVSPSDPFSFSDPAGNGNATEKPNITRALTQPKNGEGKGQQRDKGKETPRGTTNKSDPLEDILSSSKKAPSLIPAILTAIAAYSFGLPFCRLDNPGYLLGGLLLIIPAIAYLLYSNLKVHSAAMLENDQEYLSPTHLLVAVGALSILALWSAAFEKVAITNVFILAYVCAIGICSEIQSLYIGRFMRAIKVKISPRAQATMKALPFLASLITFCIAKDSFFIVQYGILVLLMWVFRRSTEQSGDSRVSIEGTHSSHILLPYQSSEMERRFRTRVEALRKSRALMFTAVCCCIGILLAIDWLFKNYANLTPSADSPPTVKAIVAAANVTNAGAGGVDASQLMVWCLILLPALLVLGLARKALSQPTFILFSPQGIRLIFTRLWIHQSKLIAWDNLIGIRIDSSSRDASKDTCIVFEKAGERVKLKLSGLGNAVDRKLMLNAIRQWGRLVPRDPAVEEILEIPSDHSYTELWLQSLAAPPKRERLKPLIAGAILQEGAFAVIRPLGSGGQGFAYLVWDTINNEEVVLKEFILPTFVSSTVRMRALEGFENEARILKSLNNEQIVRLRDFFVEDHRAYLVLDYLTGVTLKDLISQNGTLDETNTLLMAKKMCNILVYLHGLAPPVIHRDFTPDNLIYDTNGHLTLIDFNVAQEEQESTTGNIVGKHAYVPPEQFQGQARAASDIYALGATLYYLLTGVDPQPITTSILSETLPSVSSDLDALVRKATALDATDRYQTAVDLLGDIETLMATRKIDPTAHCSPSLDTARALGDNQPVNNPIVQEAQPLEHLSAPTEKPKLSGIESETRPKRRSFLPIASCAVVILSLFSLAWMNLRPFQEALAPQLKKMHANKDFGEHYSKIYEAWYRLRFKLAENLTTQLVAETGTNADVSKEYLARLYEQRAFIFVRQDNYKKALESANDALAIGPSRAAYNIRASAYHHLNDPRNAISACNSAIDLKSELDKPEGASALPLDEFDSIEYAFSLRADCELLMGNAQQALTDLAYVSKLGPLQPRQLLARGLAKEFEGDFLGATEDLTNYAEKEKQKGSPQCRSAESELARLSNYRAAKEISLDQGTAFEETEFWQIRRAIIQQQYARVVGLCSNYLKRHPQSPDYLIDQANAFAALGDTKQATQILKLVNQISPHNQESQWCLAELYFGLGDFQQSFELFKSLSESAPRAKYFFRMGELLTKQRQYTSALTSYEKALKLEPDWKVARSGHGGMLVVLGRFQEAATEIHGIEFDDSEAPEFVQGLYRLAKARHALKQYSAEEWNLQAIKDVGLKPTDD